MIKKDFFWYLEQFIYNEENNTENVHTKIKEKLYLDLALHKEQINETNFMANGTPLQYKSGWTYKNKKDTKENETIKNIL